MSSSGSNTGKVTTSRPTADAWCVLEWNSNSNPIIVDSVGISAAARIQAGVVRVTFKNPERFASGAYVVLGQHELGNAGGYCSVTPQGSITSTSSVAVGLSGSCDVSVIGFNNASATNPSFGTDTALNLRPRINLAFFCMRSDNDIRKTGVLNYGCDVEKMGLVHYPSSFPHPYAASSPAAGTCGGLVMVPNAAVAPDGTNTAVGVRVTANSLGGRKVIQYTLPSSFEIDNKEWTASIYIKAGDAGRVLRGASANVYFRDNNVGSSPTIRLNLETGVSAASVATSTYLSHSIVPVGNGWYRVSLGSRAGVNTQSGRRNFYIGLASNFTDSPANETDWSGNGSIEAYLWGFQMEEGSIATPYIPSGGAGNQNFSPITGDQDGLTVYSPGLTLSASALLNIRTKREATAYGTIVIPPSRTATGVPYLENAYGVKGVRAVNTGTYEVEFNPPMSNTGYCVITSNEQETFAVTEPVSGEGSVPHSAEYGLNILRRVSTPDDQRTLNAFRVSCLRQPSEANNPNLITNSFAAGNVLPSPMTWGAYEYTTTAVSVANESALSGGLRSAMIAVSPNWVKCVRNASGGRIAAGIPGGSNLTPEAYYRIKYYVVCDDPNFTGSSEIFCVSDNNASSDQVTRSSYVAGDKGTVRLIETFYRSVSGSNVMVLRASDSLPNGTALYITGVQVHRVLPFEARGDFYQSGREQRINFMVFGGKNSYGSE